MIRIQYHPILIEQTVNLAVRDDDDLHNALHADIDPIYEIQNATVRETQFQKAYVEWFTRLKLDRFIDETLANFPITVECVDEGFVRSASRSKSQRADLFVRNDSGRPHRSLVIQLCPESLVDPATIRDGLLRELQHVEDMLDASFGYEPDSINGFPTQRQIMRDRYCVLWDIRVERILQRNGLIESSVKSRLGERFRRAFTSGGMPPAPDAFDCLWNTDQGTHADILRRASGRLDWLRNPECTSDIRCDVSPGSPCPMCDFPTFDWFDFDDCSGEAFSRRIRELIKTWTPEQGICRQCAETILAERLNTQPTREAESVK